MFCCMTNVWHCFSTIIGTCRFKLPIMCFMLQVAKDTTAEWSGEEQRHLGRHSVDDRGFHFASTNMFIFLGQI